jgi:hypothetical protein
MDLPETRYARTPDGLTLDDAGEHELEGVPDHRQLYRWIA